jgi:NifU-like protein involved in Fe-S cluster formation
MSTPVSGADFFNSAIRAFSSATGFSKSSNVTMRGAVAGEWRGCNAAPISAGVTEPLYTTQILRLATAIPHAERLENPQASVRRVSPICGSRIDVDVDMDEDGRVARYGQEVRACALGQASAAILGAAVIGRTAAELVAARDALEAFLKGRSDVPGDWPGIDVLAPARPHKGRHGSILLPFEAAVDVAGRASGGRG